MSARTEIPAPAAPDRLGLGIRELAALLCVSRSSVYAAVAAGDLPRPRKLGRRSVWLRSEVERALEKLPRAS